MFTTLFKRDGSPMTAEPEALVTASADPECASRLQAALGNDTALLALLNESPSIDIKISAVLALSSEDALRQAERDFRTHDRRVHSVAKKCYEKRVAQRKACARADELILLAVALGDDSMIPANRLVELDQSWRELDPELLGGEQVARFVDLYVNLTRRVRDHAERQRTVSRWIHDGRQALARLAAVCDEVIDTSKLPNEILAMLEPAISEARHMLVQAAELFPTKGAEERAVAGLSDELASALREAGGIESRLKILHAAEEGREKSSDDLSTRWQSQVPVSAHSIAGALDLRFELFLRSRDEERLKRSADARQHTRDKHQLTKQAQIKAVTDLVGVAEAALKAGHVAQAVKHLPALQSAFERSDLGAELHGRLGALQADILRLREWQHWGGGRAREELVEEAETLARSVAAAEGSPSASVPVGQLEKYIEKLRVRWTELDRLGGATGKAIWQRFDSALKSAAAPVVAHKGRLAAARLENLSARESLIASLDLLKLENDENGTVPDWKAIALTLARFHTEWRKLGPIEHTVPHKRLPALTQRMQASAKRVEDPLQEVLRVARTEREALVVRAKELSRRPTERDGVGKLRELQRQWQQHSKAMPLPQPVERALWSEFKTATDALMNAREVAFKDLNAQFEASKKAREALIGRLEALSPDSPPAEIRRVLAEVTTEWRSAGEPAKDKAAKLEARMREAQLAANRYIAGSAQRMWSAMCDALAAKLALCVELEVGSVESTSVAELQARWDGLPKLAPRWEDVVRARFEAARPGKKNIGTVRNGEVDPRNELNELLLKLESTLGVSSPVPLEAARRALKLQAMKQALEGRKSTSSALTTGPELTLAAFSCMSPTEEQSARLAKIVAAIKLSGPGFLTG